MNKKEFIETSKALAAQQAQINQDMQLLQELYIKQNKCFKVGQKIEVVTPKLIESKVIGNTKVNSAKSREYVVEAFVGGWEIALNNEVVPILYKVKLDGTQSQHRLKLGERDKVRPLKKNETL